MLKTQIISDLHLNHKDGKYHPKSTSEILVVAGDFTDGFSKLGASEWLVWAQDHWRHIFFVLGNHDYWEETPIRDLVSRTRDWASGQKGLTFLHNEGVEFEGLKIFGGTMWTNFHGKPYAAKYASEVMPDYKFSVNSLGTRLTTGDVQVEHQIFKCRFEEFQMEHGKLDLVITHHMPSEHAVAPQFEGNGLNPAFYEPMGKFLKEPTTWICGHTHIAFDKPARDLQNSRIICNPRGYPSEAIYRDSKFNPDKVYEIV